MRHHDRCLRSLRPGAALPLLIGLLLAFLIGIPLAAQGAGMRVLIVGGGPEPEHNQVAIERNVHYVSRLLPAGASHITLFADGDPSAKTVLSAEQAKPRPLGEPA